MGLKEFLGIGSLLGALFGGAWLASKDAIPHKDCPDCGKRATSIINEVCECGYEFQEEDIKD